MELHKVMSVTCSCMPNFLFVCFMSEVGRSAQSYGIDHFLVFLIVWVLFIKFWGRLRGDLCYM